MRKRPKIHRHKSGLARVVLYRDGVRKDIYLGPYGSPEAAIAYQRLLGELDRQDGGEPTLTLSVVTVGDLAARYWVSHADRHYRDRDGVPTSEHRIYRLVLRFLTAVCGTIAVERFGPAALKAARQSLVDGWTDTDGTARPGFCRKEVNQRVNRVRHIFKWGVSEELLAPHIYEALRSVQGLQLGRTTAPDYDEIQPVTQAQLDATLPVLSPTIRAMVLVQLYTGMRAQEVCGLRPCDIDRESLKVDGVPIWVYRPVKHKTAWRGHRKAVAIGPKAQAILAPFLESRQPEAFLFSPREATAQRRRELRARRKTRVQPSQQTRATGGTGHQPGACYTSHSYGQAISRACERHRIPAWSTHQLRHAAGTLAERELGLDAARAMLGQRDAHVTTRYANRDLRTAAGVAAKIG